MEISLDSRWRKKIFNAPIGVSFKITYLEPDSLPQYIRDIIVDNKLEFYVKKVVKCNDEFDDDLIVFKFYSTQFYPELVRYSGNNPNVI